MASLLGWLGNGVKRVANTINNDVVQPVQRDVVTPVVHQAQAVVAQANPLDNGRTYNTVTQKGPAYAPKPLASVLQQASHNGFTNYLGNTVKGEFQGVPNSPVANAIKLGVAKFSNNPQAQHNAGTQLSKPFTQPRQPLMITKNGRQVVNPGPTKQILSLANSVGEAAPISDKPEPVPPSVPVSKPQPVAAKIVPSTPAVPLPRTQLSGKALSLTNEELRGGTNLKSAASPEEIGHALGMSGKQIREAAVAEARQRSTSTDLRSNTPSFSQDASVSPASKASLRNIQQRSLTKPPSPRSSQVVQDGGHLSMEKAPSALFDRRLSENRLGLSPEQQTPTGKARLVQSPQESGVSQNQSLQRSYSGKYTPNATKVNVSEVNPGDYQKVRSNAQLVQAVVHNHAQGVITAMRKIPKSELGEFWHKVEDPSLPRSNAMQEAITRWQGLSDTVHATSQALGGETPHLANYARHNWDLSDPNQAALYEKLMQERFHSSNYNPQDFQGLDNKPRVFDTVKQGEAMGFKLKNANPMNDVIEYAQKSKTQLKTQAVAKGMNEAESHLPNADKSETQTIGYKKSIETTKQGIKELRSIYPSAKSTNKSVIAYRKLNHGAKQFLLSVSQFHPININMQAAPALALKGHPIRAVRGLIDSAAALNKNYSDHIMQNALHDGTLEDGARIGSPVATGSDFSVGGKLDVKTGLGERVIFERQLPAMHVQMIRGVVDDLKKRGISLDSIEARKAGTVINEIMGYVNTEMRNLSPVAQRGLGDIMLAPQFTRSKWQILGQAFNPKAYTGSGLAGKYAASAVLGKYAAEAAITLAIGAALGQKSDHLTDVLWRTLVHPSIPTPYKDNKGNNVELGLPHNYASELGNLVGSLKRDNSGRIGANIQPANFMGNLAQYGRSRLAMIPGAGLKIATNTDYANVPLRDPTASGKTQAIQTATTLLGGGLPIGTQGLLRNPSMNKYLPQTSQDILNKTSTGTNPILKSAASSFGLTPRTDKTVGKGQQTTQYYAALDSAGKGLNRQEKDAFDLFTGGKKNPVTGQYEITPSANDSRAKATALLQNPKVIDHLISMNNSLAKQGQSVDPLWTASKDQITKYYQYQAMPPGSADKTDWSKKNGSWYTPLASQRDQFFNSLPSGDPNKPKAPIQYPTASPAVASLQNQYDRLTASSAKGDFIANHPELLDQWDKQAKYTNAMRTAQGYAALKNSPQASTSLQSYMDKYNAADKATRKVIRNSDPTAYQKMIAYYDSVDLYNINKQGAVNQLQGEPDQTSKQNKSISSLARDIYQNPDGTYSIVPAGWMNGLNNGSGFGSSKKPKGAGSFSTAALKPIKTPTAPHIKVGTSSIPKFKSVSLKQYSVKKPHTSNFAKLLKVA